ncbi:hypothetical protein WA158_005501 [Blastocystis sp. Blastoise]
MLNRKVAKKIYYSVGSEKNSYNVSWVCILFPIIIVAVGSLLFIGKTTRYDNIQSYNQYISKWNDYIFPELIEKKFTLFIEGKIYAFYTAANENGKYWPVRDDCQQYRDPTEGCLNTYDLFFDTSITLANTASVVLLESSTIINQMDLYPSRNETLYPHDLDCETTNECQVKCTLYHGLWNNKKSVCTYISYLTSACFILKQNDHSYIIDYDAKGCIYHNNEWKTYIYNYEPSSTISIRLRYKEDPYMIAGSLTDDCSTISEDNNQCFGLYANAQVILSLFILCLGTLIALLEIIIICVFASFYDQKKQIHICTCCHRKCVVNRTCCCPL